MGVVYSIFIGDDSPPPPVEEPDLPVRLSAGVSYIIACGAVVCATPTIFTPVFGCKWKGPIYGFPFTYPTILSFGEIQSITCLTSPWNGGLSPNLGFKIAPKPVLVSIVSSGNLVISLTFIIAAFGGITLTILPKLSTKVVYSLPSSSVTLSSLS